MINIIMILLNARPRGALKMVGGVTRNGILAT